MHFSLRFTPSEEKKLIISVSKKISKKAVVRNTIKRRVRAAFRKLHSKTGTYLIIAKQGSENIKGENLTDELGRMIRPIKN